MVSLDSLIPAPQNDEVYKPIDPTDRSFREEARRLGEQIKEFGILTVLDPLAVTRDSMIISGHRRRMMLIFNGVIDIIMVPVRRYPILSTDPKFLVLLASYNSQRVKSIDEVWHELLILNRPSPEDARQRVIDDRKTKSTLKVETREIAAGKQRSKVSDRKWQMAEAAMKIVDDLHEFWPVSDRRIHYEMSDRRVVKNTKKPKGLYQNDGKSYKNLTRLLTQLRCQGEIPMDAIGDETRPIGLWNVYSNPAPFIKEQLDRFMKGYYRNLLISQPIYLEIVAEKMTIQSIINPVASEFCIPYTIGRGFSSLPPRYHMVERFKKSGKSKMVVLFLSDFDPEGEIIVDTFIQSLRQDFHVEHDRVAGVKVGLTYEQTQSMSLPKGLPVKKSSPQAPKFIEKYGEQVWELDCLRPVALQQMLRESILGLINPSLIKAEQDQETKEVQEIMTIRDTVFRLVSGISGLGMNSSGS